MSTSLSNHGLADDVEEDSSAARIRGLSHEQLADRLQWLYWYQPGIFAAVMDYMEFCDTVVAEIDPTNPAFNSAACGDEPGPVCGICGVDIGIFVKFGLNWRHYRGDSLGESEIFDPGHAPQLAWRRPD